MNDNGLFRMAAKAGLHTEHNMLKISPKIAQITTR